MKPFSNLFCVLHLHSEGFTFWTLSLGGRVGHPEAGSDWVCRPMCRDLQWRQQAQTLHSYCHDWLPCAGAAGELPRDEELTLCLGFCLCKVLSLKQSVGPDGKPYWFGQTWNWIFHTLAGNSAVHLTYADRDKDFCLESSLLSVYVFRMSPQQGWTPTLGASCGMPYWVSFKMAELWC